MDLETRNIDGINIAFSRRGHGRPLVLIHGYPLDHSIWGQVAPLLAQDFDVIMPDLRGFGASQTMEADGSILSYASDLARLLDKLGLRSAVLAGHSMGGYVALAFARQYTQRISGLALISSQATADTPERMAARHAGAREALRNGIGSIVESMPGQLTTAEGIQSFIRNVIAKQQPAGIAGALEAMAQRPDSGDILRAAIFPVVIVHGSADVLIPVARGREMSAVLPAAHYVELLGVGHMPMMEDPRSVAEALRFFLAAKSRSVRLLDA
jgi:3-oxoadipate enol-lactonase